MPKTHVVLPGECIASIAYQHQFFPDTVWDAPENASLRALREDPNVLLAGDEVVIPDKRQRWVDCATGTRHTFVRKGVPEMLRVRFEVDGRPRANEIYELEIDGVVVESGKRTDENGGIAATISPVARRGRVLLGEAREEHQLELGHLDPIDTLSGVQGRLRNLGFFAGAVDGQRSDQLTAAVQEFQESQGLAPFGEIDDATRSALRAACDG